jgi:hypothetical protein
LYPEFAGLCVADASGQTIALDPSDNQSRQSGKKLIELEYAGYGRRRSTVYSGVYQTHAGMTGPAVAIGEPLLDAQRNLTGFVLGWFDLRSFQT